MNIPEGFNKFNLVPPNDKIGITGIEFKICWKTNLKTALIKPDDTVWPNFIKELNLKPGTTLDQILIIATGTDSEPRLLAVSGKHGDDDFASLVAVNPDDNIIVTTPGAMKDINDYQGVIPLTVGAKVTFNQSDTSKTLFISSAAVTSGSEP